MTQLAIGVDECLRLGIVGFGRLARDYYVPALASIESGCVVAVADPLEESRQAASWLCPSARTYPDFREMFDRESLHAVLVASPPSSHVAAWQTARGRGLSAFVEKPFGLASQLPELPRMSDADAGLMVNFNRRFWPAYQSVAEAVANGRLGTLRSIEIVLQTDALAWSTVTQHRLSEAEGGVLHDLGSQAIELVCQIAQREPLSACATPVRDGSLVESWELEIAFPGGISARCHLSYGNRNRETLVVVGSERCLVMREPNMAPHLTECGSRRLLPQHYLQDYAALGFRFVVPSRRLLRYTVKRALTKFVHSLRTGSEPSPGYSDAVANLRLIAQACESAMASDACRQQHA